MTKAEAQNFGREKTIKATAVAVTFMVMMLLIGETRGDFANGILFFMQAILNIHLFFILTILFGASYIFGGKAGIAIIIDQKNSLLITMKYVLFTSFLVSIYAIVLGIVRSRDKDYNSLLMFFFSSFFKIAITMLFVWLWASSSMRKAAKKSKESTL